MPGVPVFYRPARPHRQEARDEEEGLVSGVSAAELSADVRGNGTDLVEREPEHFLDVHAQLVGAVMV